MQTKLNLSESQMPKSTIKNSVVSIFLAILITVFTLVRTSLTTQTFGVDSLGLLTVIIGILPYLSTSHGGLTSVSTSKLYNDVYLGNYDNASQKIADLKAQYYLFGGFYLILTIVIAFCFPFIISPNGMISTETSNILWYESTLFILSNSVELFAVYFIVPISMILLFIDKKAYISNSYNIIFTILLNLIIILLYSLILNGVIDISFVLMNIIIFIVLGTKMIFVLIILYFYRKKYFPWYQKKKISSFKITKNSLLSVGSEYLNQFGSDLAAIVFMIYAALNVSQFNLDLQHGGDGGVEGASSFIPSAIYAAYLLMITSGNEIVHSIVDAAIPSLAEHVTFSDNQKINRHIFHRYQVLSVYIALFTVTSYLFISGLGQSVFLHTAGTPDSTNNFLNIYLIGLLWVPFAVDIFNGMYTHLLPIFGNFNSLFKISLIKSGINLGVLAVMIICFFFTSSGALLMNGIFGSIIASNLLANLVVYFIVRKLINKSIVADECVNIRLSTFLCAIWVVISLAIMLPIYVIYGDQISHLVDNIGIANIALICAGILVANFFISMLWIYWFRRVDFNFYTKEISHTFSRSKH